MIKGCQLLGKYNSVSSSLGCLKSAQNMIHRIWGGKDAATHGAPATQTQNPCSPHPNWLLRGGILPCLLSPAQCKGLWRGREGPIRSALQGAGGEDWEIPGVICSALDQLQDSRCHPWGAWNSTIRKRVAREGAPPPDEVDSRFPIHPVQPGEVPV